MINDMELEVLKRMKLVLDNILSRVKRSTRMYGGQYILDIEAIQKTPEAYEMLAKQEIAKQIGLALLRDSMIVFGDPVDEPVEEDGGGIRICRRMGAHVTVCVPEKKQEPEKQGAADEQ